MRVFWTLWRTRLSRLPLVVTITAGILAVAGGGVTVWALTGNDDQPPPTGQCRLVSVPEVSRATGLTTVKPVPMGTDPNLICNYLYDPSATITTLEELDNGKPVPAGVYVGFYADSAGINGVDSDLASDVSPVSGLGATAGWSDKRGELVVKLPHAAMRIVVDKPDPGQRLRTTDLKAIAIQVYHAAAPRLP